MTDLDKAIIAYKEELRAIKQRAEVIEVILVELRQGEL